MAEKHGLNFWEWRLVHAKVVQIDALDRLTFRRTYEAHVYLDFQETLQAHQNAQAQKGGG